MTRFTRHSCRHLLLGAVLTVFGSQDLYAQTEPPFYIPGTSLVCYDLSSCEAVALAEHASYGDCGAYGQPLPHTVSVLESIVYQNPGSSPRIRVKTLCDNTDNVSLSPWFNFGRSRCPDGSTDYPCSPYYVEAPSAPADSCSPNESNPCDPGSGNKSQVEVDYATPAAGGLGFSRFYNSVGEFKSDARLATGWRHSYSRYIEEQPDVRPLMRFASPSSDESASYKTASDACTQGFDDIKTAAWGGAVASATVTFEGGNVCKVSQLVGGVSKTVAYFPVRSTVPFAGYTPSATVKTVTRPDGRAFRFELDGANWVSLDPSVTLEQNGGNWVFTGPDDTEETYNAAGLLISIEYRNGQVETLDYALTAAQGGDDNPDTLDRVTGPFGHVLAFAYDSKGRIESVTTPDGTLAYHVGDFDNLEKVTYPDSSVREYIYDAPDLYNHLTGITDQNGTRFATWDYDATGRAILSEHAGGSEQVTLAYNANGTTTLTTANGASRTYEYSLEQGVRKLKQVTGDVCGTCAGGNTAQKSYDSNGFLDEATDWNGNVTKTARNSRGLTETLTEAKGAPEQRVTTTIWHPNFRLPTQVTRPQNTTDYVYDASGNLTNLSVTDGVDTREWVMTHNLQGQILTVDGPRAGAVDLTTFEYHNCTTGGACGQLKKITNALGHVVNLGSYDAAGRPTQITDANGLVVTMAYDNRGNLTSVTQTPAVGTARTTSMTYTPVNLIQTATTPDGQVLTYVYNDAHDLVSVTDNLNNRIDYAYDPMGNLASEDTYDPASTLKRAMEYVYDLNNRLKRETAANSFHTDYVVDAVGNIDSTTDPDLALTQHSYDPLNRLEQTTDALLGLTSYGYDGHDNLTSVTAPNNAVTTYEYNDFDDLTKEISPDRGATTYTHDPAGNVLTKTDARGKLTSYTYDGLNRLTEIELDNLDTIDFEYDVGTHAKGYLNKVTDTSGNTQWTYNQFGEITGKTQTIGTVVLTTSYGYDAQGRMTSITLPSGKVVTYGFNTYQPVSVTVDSTTVLYAATYEPFGPVNGWIWGDATTRTRSFDLRGLETSHSLATDTRTLGYSPAGELTTLDDARHDLDFDYDALRRLFDFDALGSAPLSSQDFSYDPNGNRLSFTEGASYAYTVTPNTNRVTSVAGPVPKTYTYDAAGNITNDGTTTYTYDDRGRLVTAGTATYTYNGLGQRVKKDNGSITLFTYDEEGNLIGEYDSAGNPIREHVWFDGAPVAVIVGNDVHYVHTDHLGTPRAITDSGTVIWRWESDPFGLTAAQEDPDGDLVDFTYNLRFPGQYYDSESGLHYNYFRTYDPSMRRYLESDPIGLDGGLNTYGYVGNDPLMWIDTLGLAKGGRQNLRDTGLSHLSDEEIDNMARNGETKADRRRAQREQKARQQRNIQKRKRKGNLGKVRGLVPLTIWEVLQEHCRQGLHTGLGCLPENDTIAQRSCPAEA